jgi:hypothetical protein
MIQDRTEVPVGPTQHPRSGVQTALDIVIAPAAAFAQLRQRPTWVWAFVAASLLGMIGAFAISSNVGHALVADVSAQLAASPQIAQLPADRRAATIAQQLSIVQATSRFAFLFVPFGLALASAVAALVMLVANAIGKGDGSFKKYWALAVNAGIISTGLASVITMAIVLIRGPDALASASDLERVLPGLGMFIPAGAKRALAFFSAVNVFSVWNATLLAAGMISIGRIPRATAITTAIVILLASGLFGMLGALGQR